MRKHVISVFAGFFLGLATAAAADEDRLPGPIPAKVVRVIDGDTVMVRARIWLGQDVETTVRVSGIDTPEKRGKCEAERDAALKAQDFTAAFFPNEQAWLHDVVADKYGKRVIARLQDHQGRDLGPALIAADLARPYDGGRKRGWCGD